MHARDEKKTKKTGNQWDYVPTKHAICNFNRDGCVISWEEAPSCPASQTILWHIVYVRRDFLMYSLLWWFFPLSVLVCLIWTGDAEACILSYSFDNALYAITTRGPARNRAQHDRSIVFVAGDVEHRLSHYEFCYIFNVNESVRFDALTNERPLIRYSNISCGSPLFLL